MNLRTNFLNIINALLLVFRIICGECIQPLTECWVAAGPSCIGIFYLTVLFGNFLVCAKHFAVLIILNKNSPILFQILNLFLAMVLDAFDSTSIKNSDDKEDELSKQLNNIKAKLFKKLSYLKSWLQTKLGSTITPRNGICIKVFLRYHYFFFYLKISIFIMKLIGKKILLQS